MLEDGEAPCKDGVAREHVEAHHGKTVWRVKTGAASEDGESCVYVPLTVYMYVRIHGCASFFAFTSLSVSLTVFISVCTIRVCVRRCLRWSTAKLPEACLAHMI